MGTLLGGLIFGVIVAIPSVVWLWCIIDILRNEFTGSNKIIWLVVVIFLPLLGMILYFLIGKNQKVQSDVIAKGTPQGVYIALGVLALVVIVSMAAVGAGSFYLFSSKDRHQSETREVKVEETKKEEGSMFTLDPFVVNLSDKTGNRFLKVSIQLELSSPALVETAKLKTPQIRSDIITLLSNKTSEALIAPEGKLQLKDEVNILSNKLMGDNSVRNVNLLDFVMQ